MLTRKPVPQSEESGRAPSIPPPFPVSSTFANTPAPLRIGVPQSQVRVDSAIDGESAWPGEDEDKQTGALPDLLRVGPRGYTPNSSQEMLRPAVATTNPYLKRQNSGDVSGDESSAGAWGRGEEGAIPLAASSSTESVPTQQFSKLSTCERNTNPWQPALDSEATIQPRVPSIPRHDSGNDAWAAGPPARVAPPVPPLETQPVLIDIDEPESPAWDEDEPSPGVNEVPPGTASAVEQIRDDRHAWDDQAHPLQQHPVVRTPALVPEDSAQHGEGWNLIDYEPILVGSQESGTISGDRQVAEIYEDEQAPALPPRQSQEHPPPQPPRPVITTTSMESSSSLTSPATRKQKGEMYEIKKITWHDVNAAQNPRVSPILVQNANGPCPLLALVNALTLSTPPEVETALVDTLRSREQVSLGLLLDAVFDELMSGRRGDAAQELPDVSDLYKFLVTLHTGMNVNPRFVPAPPAKRLNDPRNSMSHVYPSEREASVPGTFEETREMKLYSTFSVPLIHGWLAELDSPAYAALNRTAKSYEDAQNIMFQEEALEAKLEAEGLSFEEQSTLEDIATIKAFFASNATQLTPYGLATITASIAPGSVAILFRNDHFSTLYRHPSTLQLLQLVTDMGYAGHEEVVWESLVDINGENAEFFSGDFRLVGGTPATPEPSNGNIVDGWTPVTGRREDQVQGHSTTPSSASHQSQFAKSPIMEQEDHDFALAMQLQEEEEERHRVETARRRRETELSQQYIEQQGQAQNRTNIPVSQRGGGGRGHGSPSDSNTTAEVRPAIPPRRIYTGAAPSEGPVDPEAGVDAPPPTYEQAAGQTAYLPPADHPSHPNATPGGAGGASGPGFGSSMGPGRRMSAHSTNTAAVGGGSLGRGMPQGAGYGMGAYPGRGGRGPGPQRQPQQVATKEKDCVIM
ncbi:hypothetical protein BUE80_DR005436 [Diplocarpon rosae]|nr:hypothetical protein BUE80_DR005436 [Diplocarpon rosae]